MVHYTDGFYKLTLTALAPIGLVGALTKSLCCECCDFISVLPLSSMLDINRMSNASSTSTAAGGVQGPVVLPDPRILVVSVSPDESSSYIPIMNSIFSAQKLVRSPTWL